MKTILATAYAINPYKGSEDGTGWQYALQIARFNKLIIYTRENNQTDIEKYIAETPALIPVKNITFKYYDTPYYLRFWKKGSRGALLYFYLWQFCIARHLRKTERNNIDLVHNLNFHNNWTPTFLWLLKKPLIWGPVAFHPKIPSAYTEYYSFKERFKNKMVWLVKRIFWKLDPFLRMAVNKASYVIAPNKESFIHLRVPNEKRKYLFSVAAEDPKQKSFFEEKDAKFSVLSIGRFVKLKGFDIALRAFHEFYIQLSTEEKKKTSLTLIGKGPEKIKYQEFITKYRLESCVKIIEWLPREELTAYYKSASCFLFCSHEGAGMVVPEALSYGTPVICFDNIGPGVLINESSGFKIPYTTYKQSVWEFNNCLLQLFREKKMRRDKVFGARRRFEEKLNWNKKGEMLKELYEQV